MLAERSAREAAGESLGALAARIDAAAADPAALAALDAALAQRTEPEARRLRIHIAVLKRRAGQASQPRAAARPAATGPWRALLAGRGIEAPDGRPLHRYRLDAAGCEALRQTLRQRAPLGFENAPAELAALFVLWAAHWFQQGFRGGQRRWEDLGEALGLPFRGDDGRRLTQAGLRAWRRPVRQGGSTRQWLMTLAVEGGFPAGVLEDANGWAGPYLARVVGGLLAQDEVGPEAAVVAAEAAAEHAGRAYRQDIFYALAADLALAVIRLRREAEADPRARGLPASAWLDATRPGWRDELPIAASGAVATRLIDGLMQVEALKGIGEGSLGCWRLLRRRYGVWRPALRLGLDGVVGGEIEARLRGWQERLRAHPAGALARHAAGEIALLDPPGEPGDGWRVRPLRRDAVLADVPFAVPVTVELRCDGRPVAELAWPGSEASRGEVGVFAIEDADTLALIGTGSGAFRPEVLALAVPAGWSVEPRGEGSGVEPFGGEMEGSRLWRVTGTAVARSPEGDLYRIASGQEASRRDRLRLDGLPPRGIESEEPGVELVAGPPAIQLCEGQVARRPGEGEVRWRRDGERAWRALEGGIGQGLVEIAWREPETGFLRDRRRVFVLPAGAALEMRREGDAALYAPVGFGAGLLEPDDPDLVVERRGEALLARFRHRPARRARFRLAGGRGLAVSVPYPVKRGIARWSGRLIPESAGGAGTRLAVAALADCVAFGEGKQVLEARLLNGARRPLAGGAARWPFRDELPLRGVAEDLAALLSPFGDIDVWAELGFRGGVRTWHVRQFEAALTLNGREVSPIDGLASDETATLFGRPVTEPAAERELWRSTLRDLNDRRAPALPSDLAGAWLLYLRRGERVISRPRIAAFGPGPDAAGAGLAAAAAIVERGQREAAILACLDGIVAGEPGSAAEIAGLVALCASLRGLPPASLDGLRLLARCPAAAARLALHAALAGEEARAAVLALSDALPFAWCTVPAGCWAQAAGLERVALETALEAVLGAEQAAKLADEMVKGAAAKLAAAEPLLRWPLFAAQLLAPDQIGSHRSLLEAAQDHIRRHGDRVGEGGASNSLFRRLLPAGLPAVFQRFDAVHLETLDAPCAAAMMAAGRAGLDPDAVRRIKTAARADPLYFAEAFDACFAALARGRSL